MRSQFESRGPTALVLRSRNPDVPFVFYSRKTMPEEVIRVLKAGATDAIRKGVERREVLKRLTAAQEAWGRRDLREMRERGLNANVTVIP